MGKRQPKAASGKSADQRDPYAAPPDADLYYIPDSLKPFAVRIDSLKLDPANVKDHGEADLPTHQKSLRDFGIRRLIVVRADNRQVEAGNGTCQAALRNGWEYVPVLFCHDDAGRAAAFSLADNAVSTLSGWNPERLRELTSEALAYVGDLDVDALVQSVLADLGEDEPQEEASEDESAPAAAVPVDPDSVLVSRSIIVSGLTEKRQRELIAELQGRGFECEIRDRLMK